jgi:hypothetical protein
LASGIAPNDRTEFIATVKSRPGPRIWISFVLQFPTTPISSVDEEFGVDPGLRRIAMQSSGDASSMTACSQVNEELLQPIDS